MTFKTLCVFGTRPEAIKMAPIIKRLERDVRFTNKICVTGQHREMVTPILEWFKINPDFDLNVMVDNQNLGMLTAKILLELTDLLKHERPDCILVQGDTTTAATAALTAFYYKIPVVHIEAGLRTQDIYSPWPEEINRKIAGIIAAIHCAPTQAARQNLLQENIAVNDIYITGNTVVDALLDTKHRIRTDEILRKKLQKSFPYIHPDRKLILVTGHRRENFGQGLKSICEALLTIARYFPDVDILYPVHLNPNVRKTVHAWLSEMDNIFLIDPVDYGSFIYLMQASYLILTDSGGIQEEAPSLGKPVLVTREKTERPEAISSGSVLLVGTEAANIVTEIEKLLTNNSYYSRFKEVLNPYGDGKASERIIELMVKHFNLEATHHHETQQLSFIS